MNKVIKGSKFTHRGKPVPPQELTPAEQQKKIEEITAETNVRYAEALRKLAQ